MGAPNEEPFVRIIVIRPNYVAQTLALLRPLPPDDLATYLIAAAAELYAAGRLTPSRLARVTDLVGEAMQLDRAA